MRMENLDFDFSALLVGLTALTGIIWAVDHFFFAKGRRARGIAKQPVAVEYARSFFPVILVVMLLRSFVAEPFQIPSDSMMPTLFDGDFILVNKFTYGIRLPVINEKIIALNEPARGDVVVFRHPGHPEKPEQRGEHLIKRVVGLPGDRIAYRDNVLYVNDARVATDLEGSYDGITRSNNYKGFSRWRETLPPGVTHDVLLGKPPGFYAGKQGDWTVPAGHYLVLGDNRGNSEDGRYWGTVPEENLVGRAFFIWFSMNRVDNEFNFDRIGNSIH
jgi:signal peptidase I